MPAARGFLAEKRIAPESAGTFPAHDALFVVPGLHRDRGRSPSSGLALGPIVEHYLMLEGRLF
jgi:K+-transporting ATPase ATPase A chain